MDNFSPITPDERARLERIICDRTLSDKARNAACERLREETGDDESVTPDEMKYFFENFR